MNRSLKLAIVWTILWFALGYLVFMPTLSFTFGVGIYLFIIVYLAVLGLCFKERYESAGSTSKISWWAAGILLVLLLVGGLISSWSLFHATEFRNLIGKVEASEFTSDVAAVDPDQMITVDEKIAERIGGKVLGEQPGLGSRAELGSFTLQAVNGKLYWISPLVHSGPFKWWNFSNEGTPGYVVVSATNQEEYRLVTQTKGQDIHIKYQPDSYFGEDLDRHIYLNGYVSQGYTDYNFEVDDNWNPYWTVTLYDSKVGFEGADATGVLIVNPATGEIKQHSLKELPSWVDRVQPMSFVKTQADDWGEYIHGWWNPSDEDELSANDECSIVLANDGSVCYYIGLQSKGSENSTVGFMMVNSRTKHVKWYRQAGATEDAAKQSAEGKVQQMGYEGSDGITYNIDGRATYEFLLKDKGGLMKQIALVSVHDHNIVGIGENRQQAIRNYRTELASHGNNVSVGPSAMQKETLITTVDRIASDVTGSATDYYMILAGRKQNIFAGNTSISVQIPLTQVGDKVRIVFVENSRQEIEIENFTNLTLNLKSDSTQVVQEAAVDSVRETHREAKENQVLDNKWENMSSEEKRKLLKDKKK